MGKIMHLRGLSRILVATFLVSSSLLGNSALAESAVEYRQLGLRYRAEGQMSESIAAFRRAVALDPANLDGRVNLGWTLHLAGDDRAAANVLQESVAINPFHVPTLNALGIVYLFNEDLPGAIVAHTWAT